MGTADTVRLGRALVGRQVRFNSEHDTAPTKRVVSVAGDGMVAIEGYTGLFAPHLFRIVDSLEDLKGLVPKARWAFEMQVEAVSLEVTAIAKRIKEPILIDGQP
jgi:hypothetical protein